MLPTALAARWQAYDAWLSSKVFSGLDAVGFSDASKAASPITRDLPFVDSPTPAITTIAAYLLIVTVGAACLRQRKAGGGPDPAWLRLLVQVSAAEGNGSRLHCIDCSGPCRRTD